MLQGSGATLSLGDEAEIVIILWLSRSWGMICFACFKESIQRTTLPGILQCCFTESDLYIASLLALVEWMCAFLTAIKGRFLLLINFLCFSCRCLSCFLLAKYIASISLSSWSSSFLCFLQVHFIFEKTQSITYIG